MLPGWPDRDELGIVAPAVAAAAVASATWLLRRRLRNEH